MITRGIVSEQDSQSTRTVTRTGIGAAVGALIGAIAGGRKGAAIGAAVGAGTGAGSVFIQGHDDLELLLELLGARETNAFKNFIDALTALILLPFNTLMPDSARGRFQLKVSYLVALFVYVLLHLAINGLLRLFAHRKTAVEEPALCACSADWEVGSKIEQDHVQLLRPVHSNH